MSYIYLLICIMIYQNMSDDDKSPYQELLSLHRKQKKELQAKIQSLKKGVPKGDRARSKQVQKVIQEMQNELKVQQDKELEAFNKMNGITETTIEMNNLTIKNPQLTKITKAQKIREKKSAKAKELSARLAEAEANYENSARCIEQNSIKDKLNSLGLIVKQVPSDGNCLYSAIKDQLPVKLTVEELRKRTSCYIRNHCTYFMPFLASRNCDGVMTSDEFETYCDEINNPSMWGGQIELLALSQIFQQPIHVIQADADTTVHGEEFKDQEPIILTFHKHEFGLGKHYNSVERSLSKQLIHNEKIKSFHHQS